jgi:GAF domain-containing protein
MKTDKRIKEINSVTPNHLLKIDNSLSSVLGPKLSGDEEGLLRHIASLTAKLLSRGEASVFLVTGPPDKQVITYKAGSSDTTHQRLTGFELQIGEGVVGYTIKTGQPQLIADVQKLKDSKNGSAFCSAASELSDYPTRSLACAPMLGPDQVIGAIEIVDELPNRFSDADLNLLSSIAGFSTWLIQEARHMQVIKRQSKLLDAGAKVITQIFTRLDNLDKLFEKITDSLHLNFDFDYVGLHLFDDTEDQDHAKMISLKAASGKRLEVAVSHPSVIGDNSTMHWATTYGKPCIGLHIGEQGFRIRYVNPTPAKEKQDVSEFVAGNKLLTEPSSAITLPLTAYGEAMGAIIIQNEGPTYFAEENFPDEAINVLQTLANQLAFIIYHSRSYQQVELKNSRTQESKFGNHSRYR